MLKLRNISPLNKTMIYIDEHYSKYERNSLKGITESMGIETNQSIMTYLGKHIMSLDFDRVRIERICNGYAREMWGYCDSPAIRKAISDWFEARAI
jgi:hypothetical protein